MKAVIMAGGKGTRLKPLTCYKPKPMTPIANRPMMEHIINLLKLHNFTEIMATLFYLPQRIEDYFGDGQQFGIQLKYLIEETPLGTAGSIRIGADDLSETFLVISGDALTDIDLTAAIKFHHAKGAIATLILTKVDNPLEYGMVIVDQEGKVKRFMEKPGWGEVFSDTINTGIYILEPGIFNYFQKGQVFDFSKDLFPLLQASGEPLYGYVAAGYWSDIGNLEQYRQAHMDVMAGKVKVKPVGKEIMPGVWAGEGVKIDPEAILSGPVILGNHVTIAGQCRIGEFSVIGDYGVIQNGCQLEHSILWERCYAGTNSEVYGAVIGKNGLLKGRNTVYEGAVLGENVILRTRSVVKAGVKVWPDKIIDSGTTLNDSLIWAQKSSRNLFGNSGISGTVNREITPEFMVKLGAVFGAQLKPDAKMVVSSDNYRAARVLKRALVAGVLASGVHVYDLGTMSTSVTRYAISLLGVQGGVYLKMSSQQTDGVMVEFFDRSGLYIDKNSERALENAYFCEDFPRADANSMGELAFVPQLMEPYLRGLLDPELKDLLAKQHFKIIARYDSGSISFMLPGLFEQLSCQVIAVDNKAGNLPGYSQPRLRTLKELAAEVSLVADKIKASGADLGIVVGNDTEKLILLDDRGELLKDEQLTALLAFLVLKYKPQATMAVQVTASHFIEELAREFHGRIIRTKANPRSMMEKVAQERLFPSADGTSSYQPEFDALFCLVKVLELLARERLSLSEAKLLIPKVERGYQEAECPWEEKGRVMRNLFEENKNHPLELTDGLKVFHEQGWALILPDAEEPVFKIYSEADTAEEADALTQLYMERISELQTH
jgi:Nucleoside-diphosphate-sugar pyrophosphorylase involved in lipopolysaccharide biosynthesis/translation initiation factor 2B, gamma/epsilon subunits (eIF-2Bgamma/eIF-2Bepsilon)